MYCFTMFASLISHLISAISQSHPQEILLKSIRNIRSYSSQYYKYVSLSFATKTVLPGSMASLITKITINACSACGKAFGQDNGVCAKHVAIGKYNRCRDRGASVCFCPTKCANMSGT